MKATLLVCFTAAILHQTSYAQQTFNISSYNPTPESFKYLLLTNKKVSDNDTINENILDLVNPMLLDSVVEKRKQHHHVFLVGWLIHAFGGYNWRAVDMHKQKTVGTVKHDGRSGEVEYTEYDIKFHLQFHLRKYLNQICTACDLQRKFHRQDIRPSHHTDYEKEPFKRDTSNINASLYDLGTELTPPTSFLPQLNYLFFPTLPEGGHLRDHPNFGTDHPSMGFYGVSCLDCNHNCHPEMHPYEWTWWLNLSDSVSYAKTWLVGLFHESSNRFKNWSQNPMTGEISIPFAYNLGEDAPGELTINIEHLVFNKFQEQGLKLMSLPNELISGREGLQEISITEGDSVKAYIDLHFNNSLSTEGLKYWFSDLNLDKQNSILSGYFHFAASVHDLYTTRIKFAQTDDY